MVVVWEERLVGVVSPPQATSPEWPIVKGGDRREWGEERVWPVTMRL